VQVQRETLFRRLKTLGILLTGCLLILASLLLLLYALTPWLVQTQLPHFAADQGIELEQIELEYPGAGQLNIASLVLVAGGYRAKATGLQLDYDLTSLMHQRVKSVTIQDLVIQTLSSADTVNSEPASLEEVMAVLNPATLWQQKQKLPLERMNIRQLKLMSPELSVQGTVSLGRTELSGELEAVQEGFRSRLIVSQHSSHQANTTLEITSLRAGEKVLNLNARLTQTGQAPVLDGSFQLNWNGSLPEPWQKVLLNMNLSGEFGYTEGMLSTRVTSSSALKVQAPEIGAVEIFGKHFGTGLEIRPDLSAHLNLEQLALDTEGSLVVSGSGKDIDMSVVVKQISATMNDAFEPETVSFSVAADEAKQSWMSLRNISDSSLEAGSVQLDLEESTAFHWSRVDGKVAITGGQLTLDVPSVRWGESEFYPHTAAVVLESIELVGISAGSSGNGSLDARIQVFNKSRSVGLPVEITMGLDAMRGDLRLSREFTLTQPLIGSFLDNWQADFDVDSGVVAIDTDIRWSSEFQFSGDGRLSLHDTTLHYQDIPLTGVNVELPFEFGPNRQIIRSTPLAIHAIDLGFPVENITTVLNLQNDTLDLKKLHASVFEGSADVGEVNYDVKRSRSQFNLELSDLQLSALLQLAGGDVTGQGVIDGKLAVQYSDGSVRIPEGRVWAKAPGGELHYSAADSAVEFAQQSGFDFALTALDDFRYQSLEADVLLDADGDLALGITLLGSNPKVKNGRPIRYNLNVTQNILDLLKSLRMSGELSSQVEKRLIGE